MKFGIIFKDVKVGDKATVGEVNVQVQYAPGELLGEYELAKKILKEIPEMVTDLGTGAMAFRDMDVAFDKLSKEMVKEEATEDSKTEASNLVLTAINKIKETYLNNNVKEKPKENEAV